MEYYIWSNEHDAWWAANGRGYTTFLDRAGKYEADKAIRICTEANRFGISPSEIPVHQSVAKCVRPGKTG